jgi:hypothetical protein
MDSTASRKMNKNRSIAKTLTLLGISWFVFWACAPMMSAPPSPPIPATENNEVGLSVNGGAAFEASPFLDFAHLPPTSDTLFNMQLHYRHMLPNGGEVGSITSAGYPSMISGGGYYRAVGYSNDIFNVAPQVELGWLWVGFRVPMALKLDDKVWVTTQPAISSGVASALMVPLGISRTIGKGWRLDSEIGMRYDIREMDGGMFHSPAGPWNLMGQVGISYHGSKKHQREELEKTGVSGAKILKQP